MKRNAVIYVIGLLTVVLIISALPIYGEAEIYDDVIRLHILADSDTAEAQNAKIAVRDAILEKYGQSMKEISDKESAEKHLKAILPDIERTAADTLLGLGIDLPVTVTLSPEYYETRVYQGFRMPRGEYLSLKVSIGEAKGQNFFCVLFPALCTDSALEPMDKGDVPVGLTPAEYNLITGNDGSYRVKFKMLEVISTLFS